MGRILEKELTEAGYKLLDTSENKEKLILDILKTKDTRYLKAIPFLIYRYNPNLEKIYQKTTHKEIFGKIIEFTREIFKMNNITKSLPNISGKANLDYEEFKQEFELQRFNAEKPEMMIEKQKAYAERDLQMWLFRIFTKKERQIMGRILAEKPVSRTDYEYYSRKTKKKLNSIMGLQDFAKTIYAKTPKYDEDLYNLKKKLENWLENNSNDKEISIMNFVLWDNDKISITYKKKNDSKDQLFNTGIKIGRIKDEELLSLMNKYKKHDFR